MTTTIKDHMTPDPFVIDVSLNIDDAAARMHQHGIRHLPVMQDGHLVGVISQRDLDLVGTIPGVNPRKLTVANAMSEHPYTCDPSAPLKEVVGTMADKKIGAAVVMAEGKLVGMFSVIDAMKVLASS